LADLYHELAREVAHHGLVLRGGFSPTVGDDVPQITHGRPAQTVLMIGNVGGAMWRAFEGGQRAAVNPLDAWVARIVEPLAEKHGARPLYPYDSPPMPFQRWAQRAWPLHASPLGLLIDADCGLWHALRAALLFDCAVPIPPSPRRPSPCVTCTEKPCLTACPVGAFTADGFNYQGCRSHLATSLGDDCVIGGCRSRAACPVGVGHRYPAAQLRFHMRSFSGR
jgi:hypothetical protein